MKRMSYRRSSKRVWSAREAFATVEMTLLIVSRCHISDVRSRLYGGEHRFWGALLAVQPLTVLNRLFVSATPGDERGMRGFFDNHRTVGSPLHRVPQTIFACVVR